jgi:hypothetical protein
MKTYGGGGGDGSGGGSIAPHIFLRIFTSKKYSQCP